jgi:septum formation protein
LDQIIVVSGNSYIGNCFKLLGLPFRILLPDIDAEVPPKMPPLEFAEYLAKKKIDKMLSDLSNRSTYWICAVETFVSVNGIAIGKIYKRDEAYETIKKLSGKQHDVISTIAFYNGRKQETICRSTVNKVSFIRLSAREIEWYLNTGEWQGATGAYKIDGIGACLINKITGTHSSIAGFPMHEFYKMMMETEYLC